MEKERMDISGELIENRDKILMRLYQHCDKILSSDYQVRQ